MLVYEFDGDKAADRIRLSRLPGDSSARECRTQLGDAHHAPFDQVRVALNLGTSQMMTGFIHSDKKKWYRMR